MRDLKHDTDVLDLVLLAKSGLVALLHMEKMKQ